MLLEMQDKAMSVGLEPILQRNLITGLHLALDLESPVAGTIMYYTSDANQHVLKGALVGGPNENDEWEDDRTDYAVSLV